MVIEESILINAKIARVWDTLTDLACWEDWSKVLSDVTFKDGGTMSQGKQFSFCIRPFSVPVYLQPTIEEIKQNERLIWSGTKYGIFARHEFILERTPHGVKVTSRETFKGILLESLRFVFPEWKLREITLAFLNNLKEASEGENT